MTLSIDELLDPLALRASLAQSQKVPAVKELCELLAEVHPEIDAKIIAKKVMEREQLGSTGIGDGVAIPHCKSSEAERILCAFGRSARGVDFDSSDGEPAHIFFLLVAPEDAAGGHLEALALISRMCRRESFRQAVMEAEDEAGIFKLMQAEDSGGNDR